MKVKFGHLEIFARDPLKSREFYEIILGFEHIETQGEKYVWMKLGDKEILLRQVFMVIYMIHIKLQI